MYESKKVAVLAAGSARGEIGGAERLYGDLAVALRQFGCEVELISIPADESSYESVVANYEHCRALDLSAFDMVISTKVPTYAVRHPNHVLYLVHTTRVFYDMFDQTFPWADDAMRERRRHIHRLDSEAIGRIRHRYAIGHEVAERLRAFNGITSEVLHPPLSFGPLHRPQRGDYFFLPGRLHPWKRVDLAIRAVRASSLPLELRIAGTGEAQDELRQLAQGDPRIHFLGRISQDELARQYAGARAVLFLPVREDYGYVTLEAFLNRKAVITCRDAGEPTRFVEDGRSGLVVDPNPDAVREAIERLHLDADLAERLGSEAETRATRMRWADVASTLLRAGLGKDVGSKASVGHRTRSKTRVAVLDMQPIIPAVGGGRLRLLGLYHALGSDIETRYVGTFDWPGEQAREIWISNTLQEIDVPLSSAHHIAATQLAQQAGGKVVIDVAFPRQAPLSPDYVRTAREAVDWADAVVFSHPWIFPLVRDALRADQLVIYDAQNIEGLLRAQLLNERNPVELQLIRDVVEMEYEVGTRSDLVLACSVEDLRGFERIYGWSADKIRVTPNGVMVSAIAPSNVDEKARLRRKLQLSERQPLAIFVASDYGPNVEAARFIVDDLAVARPDVCFAVVGGVAARISAHPQNVVVTGIVDDQTKADWLRAADVALNPMQSGSGTNIKMFDFMAAGLPILSTPVGARGISTVSGGGLKLAPTPDFAAALDAMLARADRLPVWGAENRQWVETEFAWERISPLLGREIARRCALRRPGEADGPMPRVAHLSTVAQACGIGEYTARVIEALTSLGVANYVVTCATPQTRPLTSLLPAEGEVGWQWDNETWRYSRVDPDVVQRVAEWGADHLVIQYHPAFLAVDVIAGLCRQSIARGMTATVVAHNLTLLDADALHRLRATGCLLVSHSRREIAEAAAKGIEVQHLPILIATPGPLSPRTLAGRDLRDRPLVISSTGFVRAHKGLSQLIEALPLVRERLPATRLRLLCARYPAPDSDLEIEVCRQAIARLGLHDAVEFDTGFKPIEEVHARVAESDLAVLPYGPSNEGGSGSAATALAAGVPLLVTRSEVFSDIMDAVGSIDSNAPEVLARALLAALEDTAEYDRLARRAVDYANEHAAPNVARRLLALIDSHRQARRAA